MLDKKPPDSILIAVWQAFLDIGKNIWQQQM